MPQHIQLLTVENTTTPKKHPQQQQIAFLVRVNKLGFQKQLDIHWCGEDAIWHTLAAEFFANAGENQEYWRAVAQFKLSDMPALPGTIRFALCLRYQGQAYWDNNAGRDYYCHSNSGLQLARDQLLQNLSIQSRLQDGQKTFTLKIAVSPRFNADKVSILWTNDDWQHSHHSQCRPGKKSPHQTRIWSIRIKTGQAFRVQYAICCENARERLWDNNDGRNYQLSRKPLTVLVLNLHCYQEENQDHKFSLIAQAIEEQQVDLVCLQEVAEYWNHGHGDWPSNSANQINQRLTSPYHLHWDWSHRGFDQYREGVAILSRYPLHHHQARYVSANQDVYSIHSRKVVMAQLQLAYFGKINVFSAHLSWWEDGFQSQFQHLHEWAASLSHNCDTSLLCGDFNIAAGSSAYQMVVGDYHYQDQYLLATLQAKPHKAPQVQDTHWSQITSQDYRIDYIFTPRDSFLAAVTAKMLFTDHDYGRVSDHCGYLMTFEPKPRF